MRELVRMIEKTKRNDSGFTLVELLVVVAIIGVLVAIIIPVMGGQTEQAANSAHKANVRTLKSIGSQLTAFYGNPDTEQTIDNLEDSWGADNWDDQGVDVGEYVDEWPSVPDNVDEDILDGSNGPGDTYELTINSDGSMEIDPDVDD